MFKPPPALIAFLNTTVVIFTYGFHVWLIAFGQGLATDLECVGEHTVQGRFTAENKCRTRDRLNPTGREVAPTGRDELLWFTGFKSFPLRHKLHPYPKDGLLPLISPTSVTKPLWVGKRGVGPIQV
uniref:Uncharacterized protein n=1 Tax=Branchiostoma floridae TaxID=7739 RepID=C3ZNB4_BRAFL|eukprot:XP_002589931.1 hypothetical protein BRAFLDRAFT_96032 [Branchiostoma floridae]